MINLANLKLPAEAKPAVKIEENAKDKIKIKRKNLDTGEFDLFAHMGLDFFYGRNLLCL